MFGMCLGTIEKVEETIMEVTIVVLILTNEMVENVLLFNNAHYSKKGRNEHQNDVNGFYIILYEVECLNDKLRNKEKQ